MVRAPIGQRIRKRRQEVALSQVALAARLEISPSYLNLIEHNKRPIAGALLNRIAAELDLDSRALAGTEEARLIAELGEVAGDATLDGIELGSTEVNEIVGSSPKAARAILALFRAYQEARVRSDLIGERLGEDSFLAEASQQILALITTIRTYSEILQDYGDLTSGERERFVQTLVDESERLTGHAGDLFDFLGGRGARRPRPSPREEIEDFIFDRANHFPSLEDAADKLGRRLAKKTDIQAGDLIAHLKQRHRVAVVRNGDAANGVEQFDRGGRQLMLSDRLSMRSIRFRMAKLVASLEFEDLLDELVESADFSSDAAEAQLKNALASYFAGALLMPYEPFRSAADSTRHDILALSIRFDVSFEQACHRLTTLRRQGAEGVPFHFLRTDVAGNISKRFSASGLRLPRYGSACPRWIIHRAFMTPGRVLTDFAVLPDGEAYLFISSTCTPPPQSSVNDPHHAVMIGASINHAERFGYADGLDLGDSGPATPVGVTCRQCSRDDCSARAFDQMAVPGAGNNA